MNAIVEIQTQRPVSLELYKDYKELGRFMLRYVGSTIAAGVVTEVKCNSLWDKVKTTAWILRSFPVFDKMSLLSFFIVYHRSRSEDHFRGFRGSQKLSLEIACSQRPSAIPHGVRASQSSIHFLWSTLAAQIPTTSQEAIERAQNACTISSWPWAVSSVKLPSYFTLPPSEHVFLSNVFDQAKSVTIRPRKTITPRWSFHSDSFHCVLLEEAMADR